MKCATGCKTLGGGFLLASAYADDGTLQAHIPICGNCLAMALVGRIDALAAAKSAEQST
jgi:hypothetical protein